MAEAAHVLISGFADEAAITKTAREQLCVFAALGLEYYTLRFVDVGGGLKNVMKLSDEELDELVRLHDDYGMRVASIGSPIGKVKLRDVDDGTKNVFVPFDRYLREDVPRAVELAERMGTKLLRGFSFYPPARQDDDPYVTEAADRIAAIVERCAASGIVFGLEVEANLIGRTGRRLAELYRRVDQPNLVLIFDAGNLTSQNMSVDQVVAEYRAMREGIGWMHIKDYRVDPSLAWTGTVDEERLKNFVPADEGDSGHEIILRDFRERLAGLDQKMRNLGAPGVFLDLEPHLKGGGQFGGFSGPDGMGVALRALLRLLDYTGIGYRLRDFESVRRARGF